MVDTIVDAVAGDDPVRFFFEHLAQPVVRTGPATGMVGLAQAREGFAHVPKIMNLRRIRRALLDQRILYDSHIAARFGDAVPNEKNHLGCGGRRDGCGFIGS